VPVAFPYLRDGIDVYVRGDDEVHFVFLATRTRIVLRVRSCLVQSLAWLDGTSTRDTLVNRISDAHGTEAGKNILPFSTHLEQKALSSSRTGWSSQGWISTLSPLSSGSCPFCLTC